jgi:hypothetical protein
MLTTAAASAKPQAAEPVDLEPANAAVLHEATADDLQGLLERGFGAALVLRRNYGDWLRVEAVGEQQFRLEYFDAVSGKRFRADEECPPDRVNDVVRDYFGGHWNWHRAVAWCEIN